MSTEVVAHDADLSRSVWERLDCHVQGLADRLVKDRRDFHRYAETGWTEFRTASLIGRRLADLGWEVAAGREVIDAEARMGLPERDVLAAAWDRALSQGGDPAFLEALRGGFTGIVGVLRAGGGPTVGLRFDIDALPLKESRTPEHRPFAEGFASVNVGATHACGHDGHVAIGLGVASVLAQVVDLLQGTVKLIFQPAEEGVRGAKSMVTAGVVDDVDAIVALHLISGWPTGQLAVGRNSYLATDKFDARITGRAAHAGGSPQLGQNALLAAATAVLNLYAIARHSTGATRINVGHLIAGDGRNVIPPSALLLIETRGETSALNDYMYTAAVRILESAAAMYDCELEIRAMGAAQSATCDPALTAHISQLTEGLAELRMVERRPGAGSEDYTYMMRRVQARGGLATAIGLGADFGGYGHHTPEFDFDEAALALAVKLLTGVVLDLHRAS